MYGRGVALFEKKQFAQASAIFVQIMRLKPDHLPSIERMGAIALELGNHETAINLFQAVIDRAPAYAIGYANLAHALKSANRADEARACFEKACMLKPGDEVSVVMMGRLALELGDSEKAGEYFLKAWKLNPKDYPALGNYIMHVHKVRDESDEYFQALKKFRPEVDRNADLPRKMSYYQSFAKALKDLGDADAEFECLQEAIRLKRASFPYDVNRDLKTFDEIKRVFTADMVKKFQPNAMESDAPVFVVGMPRSGSTLTDQILCSHKDIASIGEADILGPLIRKHLYIPGIPLPTKATAQRKLNPVGIVREYLAAGRKMAAGTAPRFVDKSLMTYQWIGVLMAGLKNPKIIHIRRNPMDCCLSCYMTLFNDTNQPYTYDLRELGLVYRAYADMMNHWHEQFPGAILDVRYEALVEDTEGQTRRMLDYLGLPWDGNCLQFYKTERQVKTASITQVRSPIYKSSVEKWRKYEKHLGPLIEALGPYGP